MKKPLNLNKTTQLKSRGNRSHNSSYEPPHEQIIALVKFLARCAAEEGSQATSTTQSDIHNIDGE